MASTTSTGDLTSQYQSLARSLDYFRPIANSSYAPGTVLQLVALDQQSYPDFKTAQPCPTSGSANSLVGTVLLGWSGFNGSDPPAQYTSGSNVYVGNAGGAGLRGTLDVETVTQGIGIVLIDATAGSTLTDKVAVVRSATTAGYGQGQTSPVGGDTVVGEIILPSTGIGSSIAAAALVQASQTNTIATPATGDQVGITIQTPWIPSAPGVVQTTQFLMPALTAAQATSATTAGTAFAAFLNAQPGYNKYFTATSSAGVVTTTVNANSVAFMVNWATNGTLTGYFEFGLSGVIANTLTFTAQVVGSGGTANTAQGSTLASGAGYKGRMPIRVTCGFSV